MDLDFDAVEELLARAQRAPAPERRHLADSLRASWRCFGALTVEQYAQLIEIADDERIDQLPGEGREP